MTELLPRLNEALYSLMNGRRWKRRAERVQCTVGPELQAARAQLRVTIVKGRMIHTKTSHERIRRIRLEIASNAERATL